MILTQAHPYSTLPPSLRSTTKPLLLAPLLNLTLPPPFTHSNPNSFLPHSYFPALALFLPPSLILPSTIPLCALGRTVLRAVASMEPTR